MILIDSHCHLDMLAATKDLNEIVASADANQVKYMQTICTKLSQLPQIIDIIEKFDNIFASVGVHPCESNIESEDEISYEELTSLSAHKKIIAFGETGLDYYHQPADSNKQIEFLEQHIIASQSTNLPIIVHTRNAENDTSDILSAEQRNASFSGLIHCFTASKDFAKQMLDIGMYISISGIITFKNTESLRDIVRYIPLDRLLIETGSPYLAPIPMRGKQNEPAFLKYVAECVANLKETSVAEIAAKTTDNFFKLFSKAIITS